MSYVAVAVKEYISLVEETATFYRLTKIWLTQPLPACFVGSYTVQTDR